jgi:hypothetical protein
MTPRTDAITSRIIKEELAEAEIRQSTLIRQFDAVPPSSQSHR